MAPGRDLLTSEDANTARLLGERGQARPGHITLERTLFCNSSRTRRYVPLPELKSPPDLKAKTRGEFVQKVMAAKNSWALPEPEVPVAAAKHPKGCLCERHKLKVKQRNRFVHPLSKASQ